MRGHHVTPLQSAQFTVRVPKDRLSLSTLRDAEVVLYRLKQSAAETRIAPATSLSAQFGQELREVARMRGIRLEALPAATQGELRRILR